MGIKEILKSEEELIRRHLLEDVGTDTFEVVVPSERQIRLAHNKAHAETINSLIYAYLSKKVRWGGGKSAKSRLLRR